MYNMYNIIGLMIGVLISMSASWEIYLNQMIWTNYQFKIRKKGLYMGGIMFLFLFGVIHIIHIIHTIHKIIIPYVFLYLSIPMIVCGSTITRDNSLFHSIVLTILFVFISQSISMRILLLLQIDQYF